MTRTLLSIRSPRALGVDGAVDGRVDWHEFALIGKAICGRMNQRFEQHAKGEKDRSPGTQGLASHLPGRFDKKSLSTKPTFPEDCPVNALGS